MKPEHLPIFFRAHTATVQKSSESPSIRAQSPQWPNRVLLFDTESCISIDQTFLFGIHRICDLVDGKYRCSEEGIVYDELSKRELNAIRNFAKNTFPDIEVPSFPPKVRFALHRSLLKFMEEVFFPGLREGWLIAGFNLPFDLSRFSLDWRKTRKGGFALILSKTWWRKTQSWIPNPYRPTIKIEPKDARTAFISRGSTKCPAEWLNQGRLLDIGTFLFALFDQRRSLRDWCRYFREERNLGWVLEKLDHEPSGRVTLEELEYCGRDVQCTQDLLNCAKSEFDLYGLDDLLPDKAYSPASVGKATFRQLGITPPPEKFEVSHELQGVFMQSYFGGRAESHIRKVLLPTMRLDFLSQYPTVNTNMGLWEILTAKRVSFPESTRQIRKFLKQVTLDK